MGRAFEVRKASMMKTSAAKAKLYSKFGKEIYVEAKNGVPDPEMNQSLKRIVERARAQQVPADVINRAIDKAKGNDDTSYHAVRYEGFGPAGSTFIVECLTDNDNRSVSEVRNAFTKSRGKMGVGGSVIHGYEHVGVLGLHETDEERIMDILFEAEVDLKDIEVEDGQMSLTVETTDLYKAKEAIESQIPTAQFEVVEITYLPNETVTLDNDEDVMLFERLTTLLEACEDVQDVYHNIIEE